MTLKMAALVAALIFVCSLSACTFGYCHSTADRNPDGTWKAYCSDHGE